MQQQPPDTCGQELATSATIPDQFGALFKHIALNLRDHANWVGVASPKAKAEHEALLAIAERYEHLSHQAQDCAAAQRALATLPQADHNPTTLDRPQLAGWMKQKLTLQRKLAEALLGQAEQTQQALEALEG